MKSKEKTKEMGAGGFCICPNCGFKMEHPEGIPCKKLKCPKCQTQLIREGSDHDINQSKNEKTDN